jgi:ribokinase
MTTVVVVGSANLDVLIRLSRPPRPGETVIGDTYGEHPGGKGANQAAAAARVAPTAFVGALGTDPAADVLKARLRADGVDATQVTTVGTVTGRAFIHLTPDGENSIVVLPGANANLPAAHVETALHALGPTVVLTQLETPPDVTTACARWARANGARFILNASPTRPVPADVLALADPLIVNAGEARDLLNDMARTTPDDIVAGALAARCQSLIVTRGGDGTLLVQRGSITTVPTVTVVPVDTTGAGDAFAGTLAGHLAVHVPLATAAQHATAEAARVIQIRREQR